MERQPLLEFLPNCVRRFRIMAIKSHTIAIDSGSLWSAPLRDRAPPALLQKMLFNWTDDTWTSNWQRSRNLPQVAIRHQMPQGTEHARHLTEDTNNSSMYVINHIVGYVNTNDGLCYINSWYRYTAAETLASWRGTLQSTSWRGTATLKREVVLEIHHH